MSEQVNNRLKLFVERESLEKELPLMFQKNKDNVNEVKCNVKHTRFLVPCLCCYYVCVVSLIKKVVFLWLSAERMENVKISMSGIDATVSSDHTHTQLLQHAMSYNSNRNKLGLIQRVPLL